MSWFGLVSCVCWFHVNYREYRPLDTRVVLIMEGIILWMEESGYLRRVLFFGQGITFIMESIIEHWTGGSILLNRSAWS